jgi:hypothetical protein
MSGSFLTGPPREANQGGKEGDFIVYRSAVELLAVLTDMGADLIHIVPVAAIQSASHRSFT